MKKYQITFTDETKKTIEIDDLKIDKNCFIGYVKKNAIKFRKHIIPVHIVKFIDKKG